MCKLEVRPRLLAIGVAATFAALGPATAAEVVVGVELPLTGPVATWGGIPVRNGIEIALEDVKAKNLAGDNTLKVLMEDMASDKNQAITLANRFAKSDHVAVIIGPSTSGFSTAVAPIANDEKVPLIAFAASGAINKPGPYGFKMIPDAAPEMDLLANFVNKTFSVKNYASVYNRDNDAYVAYHKQLNADMTAAGVPMVAEETTVPADVDFTTLGTKLADVNPDAIFMAMVAEQAANLIIQARQAGLSDSVKLFGNGGGFFPQYAKIGGDAVNGTYFFTHYFIGLPGDLNKNFVEKYRAKFNSDPDEFAAFGYTAVMLVANAVSHTNSGDREAIRTALAGTKDFPTILGAGKFAFDDERAPHMGLPILQLKDGQPVLQELVQ